MASTGTFTMRSDTVPEPIKFLGCSVISFSSQMGWGQDSSTLTVELVEDCEVPLDANGNPEIDPITGNEKQADRFWGRDMELIGTARYFDTRDPVWVANREIWDEPTVAPRWKADFYFGGIVTNWTQKQGTSGVIFTVNLVDAKTLLNNVYIETDTYSWFPLWQNNYFNVLGKYEYKTFYGDCKMYGTANSNPRGMNANNITQGLLNIGFDDIRADHMTKLELLGSNFGDRKHHEEYGQTLDAKHKIYNQRPMIYSPLHGEVDNAAVAAQEAADAAYNFVFRSNDEPPKVQHTAFSIDFGLYNDKRTYIDEPYQDNVNIDVVPTNEELVQWRTDSLPIVPNFYRVAGSITMLDYIQNLCDLTARDWYVTMEYNEQSDTHVIRIRTVHLIDDYEGNYNTLIEKYNGAATELSYGKEFSNEKTRNMIMGENVHYMSQSTLSTYYFGDDGFGNPQAPLVDYNYNYLNPLGGISPGDNFWVLIDVTQLNVGLYTPFPSNKIWVSERDILAAAAGKHIWEMRATAVRRDKQGNEITDNINAPAGSINYHLRNMHPGLKNLAMDIVTRLVDTLGRKKVFVPPGVPTEQDNQRFPVTDMFMNTFGSYSYQNNSQKLLKDLETIYNFINDLGTKYYGKQYLCRLNETVCYNYLDPDAESGSLEYSSNPTNEGAWIDPGEYALGLHDGYLAPFKTEDGRVGAFVRFDTKGNMGAWGNNLENSNPSVPIEGSLMDLSTISPDSYMSDGAIIWLKANVKERVYIVSDVRAGTDVPAAVVELASPAFAKPQVDLRSLAEQILTSLMMMYRDRTDGQDNDFIEDGSYTTISITNRGSGYMQGDLAYWGENGKGTVNVSDDEYGYVTSINITYGDGGENNETIKRGDQTDISIESQNPEAEGFAGKAIASNYNQNKYWGLPNQVNKERNVNNILGYDNVHNNNNIASHDAYWLGVARKAILPSSSAIPMKSNIAVYGPYYSDNFFTSSGGVKAQQAKDLAPWNFGSYAIMNEAGLNRATYAFEETQQPLVISELGDVRLLGMPEYSLGDKIDIDGVVQGPIINNVNVSFGAQGVTTGLGFKTFSRKFGNLPAVLEEQIKLVGQNREKQLQFIRENIIKQSIIGRKSLVGYVGPSVGGTLGGQDSIRSNRIPRYYNGKGEQRVIMGETYDWTPLPRHSGEEDWHQFYPREFSYGQRNVTSIGTFDQFMTETGGNYDKKGFMSLDGMYSSVSLAGDGELPRFPSLANIPTADRASSAYPNPPSIHKPSYITERPSTGSATPMIKSVGLKKLQVSAGLNYLPGQGILLYPGAISSTSAMRARILDYDKITGVMYITVTKVEGGGGTYANWIITPDGDPVGDLDINQVFQNPLTNSNNHKLDPVRGFMHHFGPGEGHNIDIVGMRDEVAESGAMLSMQENVKGKYSEDYRFIGMRGPLVLHQWGYDTEGKPIPNRADVESATKSGSFTRGVSDGAGLQDFFLQDWLQKPQTWPVGPIDLRFDRNRGVWVSPPPYKIVVIQTKEIIPAYGKGKGMLINQHSESGKFFGNPLHDSFGVPVSAKEHESTNNTEIWIEDRVGQPIGKGFKMYGYYDTYSGTYLAIGNISNTVIGKFCNQWPSLMNVSDPKNCIKKVVLYHAAECATPTTSNNYTENCAWRLEPVTIRDKNGIDQPVVVQAANLFANVAAHEYQTKWCALSCTNGFYYLTAAES